MEVDLTDMSSLGAPERASRQRERVLIVDDDPSVGRLLEHILSVEEYRCARSGSLAEARRQLAERRFDVILCDVGLPDGSGLDLIEEVMTGDGQIAALVISGLDEVALAERALRLGAYGYIVKPFTANDVLIGVFGALAHRRRALDALSEASAEIVAVGMVAFGDADHVATHCSRHSMSTAMA